MAKNKNKRRDETILDKILKAQEELSNGIKQYKIAHTNDLSNIDTLTA